MHDERTPAERLDASERDVLFLLTVHGLWRAGLIHKTSDGFVFATRSGVRAVEIVGRYA